jgi:hypothetical protein
LKTGSLARSHPPPLIPFHEPHVNASRFLRSRRLSSGKSRTSALSSSRLERCARWPTGAAAARVHRRSKTSTRPSPHRFRGLLSAACASTTSAETMFQRALPRTTRAARSYGIHRSGRLSALSIVAFRSRTAAEGTRGQGPRITESSALPPGIAPGRDFAPTPIASDTSRRGHLLSPCPERRGRLSKPPTPRALARHEQREGRATPDLREEIRRSPTRGAFRRMAVRKRGDLSIG